MVITRNLSRNGRLYNDFQKKKKLGVVVCYFRAWARVKSGPLKDVVKTHVVKELSPKLCPT